MLGLVSNGSVCEGWDGGMTACKCNDMLDLVSNGSVCEGCNKCWAAMGVFVRAVINVGPCQL